MIFDLPKMLIQELGQTLQGHMKDDLSQSQLQSLLQSALRKCNLVTRDEFDAQKAVLLRTREKLEHLEREVAQLSQPEPVTEHAKPPSDGSKPVIKPKTT